MAKDTNIKMSELLLELYSEEIPSKLQVNAREELTKHLIEFFDKEKIKHKISRINSSPTRIFMHVIDLPKIIRKSAKEIKGPKADVSEEIIKNFLKSHSLAKNDLYKKNLDKGEFFFVKTKETQTDIRNTLKENLPKIISRISWRKSMRWSTNSMYWGRPLRSIFALFDGELLEFSFEHLNSKNEIILEKGESSTTLKIKNSNEYLNTLKKNNEIIDQNLREKIIINKFKNKCKTQKFKEEFDSETLNEVINIVDNPNVLLTSFDKNYLTIPKEIIITTLQSHQRYFPLFNYKNELTNYFFVVSNRPDKNNIIKNGNQRVVEARLSDAKFFWEKDKSKNLIKQISKLKNIKFYEKLGTIYDKTQRLRKLASLLSDEVNLNKEKVEIAASISKSDLCSDLVGEYPELQGKMGEYFALSQGFENDVASSISDHYLPYGNKTKVPKKPISYVISIADKVDTLVGFFLINLKPSSSKDPFALRRSAVGLLKTLIENKIYIRIKDLISYDIKLFEDQGVKLENNLVELELMNFLKNRMKFILKEKNIKSDIIEASLNTHVGDDYYDLYKKNLLMNKYIDKEIGKNVISSYKRAFNIIENQKNEIRGRPDTVLFRKEEEKNLYHKINEIRKDLVLKEKNKNYEDLLKNFSEIKIYTDNFFDKVVVNDENNDIKNNRLELLKMFCNTFNNFMNFSKLEGFK